MKSTARDPRDQWGAQGLLPVSFAHPEGFPWCQPYSRLEMAGEGWLGLLIAWAPGRERVYD